jgi:RNA polymerase sigma-70 factor (ECF subfamily)
MQEPWNDPGALVKQYAPAVYRLAYARTGSRADAEDVMQETFLRLIKFRPSFDSEEHAKAWLLRVASNCANDLFRLPWRRREEPLDENLSAPERPEEGSVTQAVLSLPARYRIPIHLYYYEGYSVAEIARILGRSEGTVKSRLFRARDLLRNQLREEEDGGQIQV